MYRVMIHMYFYSENVTFNEITFNWLYTVLLLGQSVFLRHLAFPWMTANEGAKSQNWLFRNLYIFWGVCSFWRPMMANPFQVIPCYNPDLSSDSKSQHSSASKCGTAGMGGGGYYRQKDRKDTDNSQTQLTTWQIRRFDSVLKLNI